jgi:DNA-directed RNA polymerase specialized sigma24 family protein
MTDRREEMREMRQQGHTYREIGDAFGITKQRAYDLINRNPSTRQLEADIYSANQWQWVADCRKEGYTLKEIAAFLDLGMGTVYLRTRNKLPLPPLELRKAEFCALPDECKWDWINERYVEGHRAKALADFLGMPVKAVRPRLDARYDRDMLPPLDSRKAEFNRLG